MAKKAKTGSSLIASNKKAYHEYHVLEQLTAGIVLTGTEIKSIRQGKVSLNQAFAKIDNEELFLYGLHIAPYEQGSYNNHDPDRVRKLLLTKREIKKLTGKIQEAGMSIIPLRLFFSRAWVKVEIGICKGKKLYDKRADLKKKDQAKEMSRAMKANY